MTTPVELATDAIWSAIVEGRSTTVRLNGSQMPATGYYVGGVTAPLVNATSWGDVREFIRQSETAFVGAWRDTDGSTYVDDVTWTPDLLHAQRLAAERAEIAFYDIANCRDIRV